MSLTTTRWPEQTKSEENRTKKTFNSCVRHWLVCESYRVSFHMLINSRVTTGKLIPQSLSSFNEDNYEKHKCKHLIVVYTNARACKISLLDKNIVLIHFRHHVSLFPYKKKSNNFNAVKYVFLSCGFKIF